MIRIDLPTNRYIRIIPACLLVTALMFGAANAHEVDQHEIDLHEAGEGEGEDYFKRKRFSLGVGGAIVRFDTNFTFSDKNSPLRVVIDGEGSIGLPEKESVPVLFGHFKMADRHYFGFSYFQVKREAILFQYNESTDIQLGDLTITAGANAKVSLTDKTAFSYLSYNYALFDDDRSIMLATLGLYGLDLRYVFDANGEITLNDTPVIDGQYQREIRQFAPLPMIGIDAWHYFTPKWALGTKVTLVGGSYENISAGVLDTTVRVKYQFAKNFGVSAGITYFNSEITIDEPNYQTEVDYGFDGAALGLHFNF